MPGPTLILQRRATRTGAQVSLWRWLKSGALDGFAPRVVCGEPGWLTEALTALGVPVEVHPFPSSRALAARAFGNRAFARRLAGARPRLVIGNDHPEGLLARAVARASRAPCAMLLRSFGATARDLRKYACHEADLVIAVGEATRAAAEADLGRPVLGFEEGLLAEEWHPPKPPSAGLGPSVLVVGTPNPAKGWPDLLAALEGQRFPGVQWRFTASPQEGLPTPDGVDVQWVGRAEDYAGLVRAADLVVHPSRGETFGLAMVEAWAAGVPVLASRTGVNRALPVPEHLRFEPGDVAGLGGALLALRDGALAATREDIERVQAYLTAHHAWPSALAPVTEALEALALA